MKKTTPAWIDAVNKARRVVDSRAADDEIQMAERRFSETKQAGAEKLAGLFGDLWPAMAQSGVWAPLPCCTPAYQAGFFLDGYWFWVEQRGLVFGRICETCKSLQRDVVVESLADVAYAIEEMAE